jgi:hypothetical protein
MPRVRFDSCEELLTCYGFLILATFCPEDFCEEADNVGIRARGFQRGTEVGDRGVEIPLEVVREACREAGG